MRCMLEFSEKVSFSHGAAVTETPSRGARGSGFLLPTLALGQVVT